MSSQDVLAPGGDDVAAVCDFWKRFDLDGRRHKLDQQALDMRARHEASATSRRVLAESTKKFRAMDGAAKLNGLTALLRQYQEEVDTLTRRARHSEKAFRDLFRSLIDAPDPAAALTAVGDGSRRASELGDEVTRLKAELAEYETEFSSLKNQDITIRQLEERLRGFEDDVEQQVADAIAEREQELRASLDRELEAARLREVEREKALASAQQEVAEAHRSTDDAQSQLLELRERYDEDTAAFRAEIEVLAQESDRANGRVLSLTKELQRLRDGEASQRSSEAGDVSSHVETTKRLLEAEAEAARQRTAMKELTQQWEAAMGSQQQQHEEAMAQLMEEVAARKAEVAQLHEELESRTPAADVAALRRKVANLEALHFNVERDDDDDDGDAGVGDSGELSSAVARVRHLDSEVVRLRREKEELHNANTDLTTRLEQATERQRQQDALVAKLEAQLEQQISGARHAPQQPTDAERTGSSSAFHLSHALGSPLAASAEAEATANGAADGRGDLQGRSGGAAVGTLGNWESNSLSLVDILRGQRDRFRGKVLELEKQCQQLRTELAAEKKRGAQVTQDNVKLFQKVKYLQSYSRAGSGSGQGDGGGGSGGGSSGDQLDIVETGGTGGSARRRQDGLADFEAPYSRMYEETVNPFTVFNRREKQRRYKNLTTAEKITLSSSRFFLSNKYARNFIFFYSLALHLLVFSTLFHFTHVNHKACK